MKVLVLGALCVNAAVVIGGMLMNVSLAQDQAETKLLKTVQIGTPHDALYGIGFDRGKGVAVGVGGAIFESDDGGLVWKPVAQSATQLALLAVAKLGTHAIAVGQTGIILVEDSPGEWKAYPGPTNSRLFAVSTTTAGVVVAAGEFGTVIKSNDGGHSWTSIAPANWDPFIKDVPGGNTMPHVYAANISENGEITVAGEFGLIIHSKDGGKSWQPLRKGQYLLPSLFSLYQTEKGERFAVGQNGDIERSTDNGSNWKKVITGSDANLLSMTAKPGGQEMVVTGMRAMLHSTNGGATWSTVNEDDTLTDWYQAVRTDSASGRIEAVGHAGKIIEIGG